MPPFLLKKSPDDKEGNISEEDLMKLIAYVKSLGPGQTPSRVEEALPPARRETKKDEKK
jgi:hypothetical protein